MASVTITGTLRDAFGVALANYDILFEAVRTSDVVLNSTSAKGVTSSTGTYTFELGYGTYTLKIKSNRESQYRTVASNILVYSQAFDSHDLNYLLTSQLNLQDIDESLFDQLLTIKSDTLGYKNAAAASATASESSRVAAAAFAASAATSASSADTSEANALASANAADISEANALASANAADISEANAQKWAENPENVAVVTGRYSAKHHAIKAAASAASALTSANNADISEANALASANAADISEANALSSANMAAMYAASMAAAISENGNVDLSSGIAPTPLKDGSNNNISTLWKVTVAGTVNSISYAVGDSIVYSKALNGYYKIDSTDQVTSVNGMSGAVTVTTITGNAGTATKLATARSISTSGDITWTVSFDGSANVTAAATLSTTGVTTGTYKSVTVDSKGRVTAATNPTTLSGFGITDAQPLDSDLSAIADLTTNGIIIKTAAGTATTRSIAVSGSGISITNADGINGNPTITSNATALNTASTVVFRDASGNFSAGGITLSGPTQTIGSSTATSTISIGSGATASAATKTINIGTSGLSGSTTNITIGSSTSTGNITVAQRLVSSSTGSWLLPVGITAERDSTAGGSIRYNSASADFEGCSVGGWLSFLQKGDYGFGTNAETRSRLGNLDTVTQAGFYVTTADAVGLPISGAGYLWHQDWDGATNYRRQVFHHASVTRVFIRWLVNGTWSTWLEQYGTSNILGTVGMSGSLPIGAIIEAGSNANGTYTKFADGTMVCHVIKTTASIDAGGVGSASWTYPAAFINTPTIQTTIYTSTPQTYYSSYTTDGGGTSGIAYVYNGSADSLTRSIFITANGKWY